LAGRWKDEKTAINLVLETFAQNIKGIELEPSYQTQIELMLKELTKAKDSYFEESIPSSKERNNFIKKSADIMLQYKPKIEPVAWETLKDFGITLLNALRTIARFFGAEVPRQTLFGESRIEKQNEIEVICSNAQLSLGS
jgi:hypothetical protein